jgi:hypothetical protein
MVPRNCSRSIAHNVFTHEVASALAPTARKKKTRKEKIATLQKHLACSQVILLLAAKLSAASVRVAGSIIDTQCEQCHNLRPPRLHTIYSSPLVDSY